MNDLKEIAELISFASNRLYAISARMVMVGESKDVTDRIIRDDADTIMRRANVNLINISRDLRRIADHVATSTPIDIDSFK